MIDRDLLGKAMTKVADNVPAIGERVPVPPKPAAPTDPGPGNTAPPHWADLIMGNQLNEQIKARELDLGARSAFAAGGGAGLGIPIGAGIGGLAAGSGNRIEGTARGAIYGGGMGAGIGAGGQLGGTLATSLGAKPGSGTQFLASLLGNVGGGVGAHKLMSLIMGKPSYDGGKKPKPAVSSFSREQVPRGLAYHSGLFAALDGPDAKLSPELASQLQRHLGWNRVPDELDAVEAVMEMEDTRSRTPKRTPKPATKAASVLRRICSGPVGKGAGHKKQAGLPGTTPMLPPSPGPLASGLKNFDITSGPGPIPGKPQISMQPKLQTHPKRHILDGVKSQVDAVGAAAPQLAAEGLRGQAMAATGASGPLAAATAKLPPLQQHPMSMKAGPTPRATLLSRILGN